MARGWRPQKKVYCVNIWEWERPLLYLPQTIVYSRLTVFLLLKLTTSEHRCGHHLKLFFMYSSLCGSQRRGSHVKSVRAQLSSSIISDSFLITAVWLTVSRWFAVTLSKEGGGALLPNTMNNYFHIWPHFFCSSWSGVSTWATVVLLQISSIWPEMSRNNVALFLWLPV